MINEETLNNARNQLRTAKGEMYRSIVERGREYGYSDEQITRILEMPLSGKMNFKESERYFKENGYGGILVGANGMSADDEKDFLKVAAHLKAVYEDQLERYNALEREFNKQQLIEQKVTEYLDRLNEINEEIDRLIDAAEPNGVISFYDKMSALEEEKVQLNNRVTFLELHPELVDKIDKMIIHDDLSYSFKETKTYMERMAEEQAKLNEKSVSTTLNETQKEKEADDSKINDTNMTDSEKRNPEDNKIEEETPIIVPITEESSTVDDAEQKETESIDPSADEDDLTETTDYESEVDEEKESENNREVYEPVIKQIGSKMAKLPEKVVNKLKENWGSFLKKAKKVIKAVYTVGSIGVAVTVGAVVVVLTNGQNWSNLPFSLAQGALAGGVTFGSLWLIPKLPKYVPIAVKAGKNFFMKDSREIKCNPEYCDSLVESQHISDTVESEQELSDDEVENLSEENLTEEETKVLETPLVEDTEELNHRVEDPIEEEVSELEVPSVENKKRRLEMGKKQLLDNNVSDMVESQLVENTHTL